MTTKEQIGGKIRQLRTHLGFSQEELGKVLNKSHAAISDIERGKTELTISDLLIIAECLKTPVTYFLNIQTSPANISIQFQGESTQEIESGDFKVNVKHNSFIF